MGEGGAGVEGGRPGDSVEKKGTPANAGIAEMCHSETAWWVSRDAHGQWQGEHPRPIVARKPARGLARWLGAAAPRIARVRVNFRALVDVDRAWLLHRHHMDLHMAVIIRRKKIQ